MLRVSPYMASLCTIPGICLCLIVSLFYGCFVGKLSDPTVMCYESFMYIISSMYSIKTKSAQGYVMAFNGQAKQNVSFFHPLNAIDSP